MSRRLTVLLMGVLPLLVAAWAAAPTMAGAATAAPLTGETLSSDSGSGSVYCQPDPTQPSTVTFDVSGTAEGPYPGTFTEQGQYTVVDSTNTIQDFSADLTIDAGTTTIDAHLTVDPSGDNFGSCSSDPYSGDISQLDFLTDYTATISSDSGSASDQGTAPTELSVGPPSDGPTPASLSQGPFSSTASQDHASESCVDGCRVSTGHDATPDNPLSTTVVVPPSFSGEVTIDEGPGTQADCPYPHSFGQTSTITAPTTTPEAPMRFIFIYDASVVPSGVRVDRLPLCHDGVKVPHCSGGNKNTADPAPSCVESRRRLTNGDVKFLVLTAVNGRWRG